MPWKYVLVGLALFFQGNLLVVESREREEYGGSRGEEASILNSLLDYVQKRPLARGVYHDLPEDDDAKIQDAQNSERGFPDSRNKDPQVPPSSTGGGGQGTSDNGRRPSYQEVDPRAREPLKLAVRQSETERASSHRSALGFSLNSLSFIMIVAGCTVLAAIGVVGAGVCWYKYNKRVKSASVVDYPAYGVTGPAKDHAPSPGDRKLAQSAQMYHYQHQKQQMIAMEKANGSMKHDASDEESEEDNVEGDYTVYECPGLAPTGEMEVKNPLFRGDETPSTPVNEDPPPQTEDK